MKNKKVSIQNIFLYLVAMIFCCALACYENIETLLQDATIQIKTGMMIIENKSFIMKDVFSWHEGLNWVSHSQLWYVLLGFIYSAFGVVGCLFLLSIFNTATTIFSFIESRKQSGCSVYSIVVSIIILKAYAYYPITIFRPTLISNFLFEILILSLLYCKSNKKKSIIFIAIIWTLAWFHGGVISIAFAIFALYTIIQGITNKNLKLIIWNFATVGVAFVFSCITPNKLDIWTFGSNQFIYPEIMGQVQEWQSGTFSAYLSILFLITIIGMVLNNKMREFDSNHLFKTGLVCMFFVASCLYGRGMYQLSLVMLLFLPEAIETIVKWITKKFSLNISQFEIDSKYFKFLCGFISVLFIITHIMLALVLKGNTINSTAVAVGYDMSVIQTIKDKGYEKIYNDFDTGSWLLFNDIKVHVDNRIDPYLTSYSGEDHIHNEMVIDSLTHMNDFYEKYHPDAILLRYSDPLPLESGEFYPHSNSIQNLVEEMIYYEPEKYKKVYENTTTIKGENAYTWVIFECCYD